MKIIVLALTIILLLSASICMADDTVVKEAYSLYYKGQKTKAITKMEDYVQTNQDPGALYFLGYAYYEMKQMDKAGEYFSRAFRVKDFYSPVSTKEGN